MPRLLLATAIAASCAATLAACSLVNTLDDLRSDTSAEAGTGRDSGRTSNPGTDASPVDPLADSGVADSNTSADASADAAAAKTYRDEVLADSPSVYLRLGEKSGATAKDEIGAFPGTFPTNGGFVYGEPGAIVGDTDTAITLNDGKRPITFGAGLDFAGTASFTVELWAKQTGYDVYSWTVDHFAWAAQRNGWGLRLSDDQFGVERWANGSTNGSTSFATGPIGLGVYHHIVATFDGASICIFRDTIKMNCSPATNSPIQKTTGIWTLGARNDCPTNCQGFIGSLDEFAIYPTALPEARIQAHYNKGTGK